MSKNILIIQGHPDVDKSHFCHAIENAYVKGASVNNYKVQSIYIAELNFPIIRTKEDFEIGAIPPDIKEAQEKIKWANHIVVIYPLWLGTFPALLKAFFEQAFRYGFAISYTTDKFPEKLLAGKSARIIVTMGMPAFVYNWVFKAHSLKSLQLNILGMSGIKPIRHTLIGSVDDKNSKLKHWLDKIELLGKCAK